LGTHGNNGTDTIFAGTLRGIVDRTGGWLSARRECLRPADIALYAS
jgi:hypothetical protein